MLDNETRTAPEALLEDVKVISQQDYRFLTATCWDLGTSLEILYHFEKDLSVRTLRLISPKQVEIPSITGIYPAALLVEREMNELLGARITGIDQGLAGRFLVVLNTLQMPLMKTVTATSVAPNPN